MMTKTQRLEMAAFIQEADDVYTTRDGFGIVCVKGDFTRIFVLDELTAPLAGIETGTAETVKQGSVPKG